MDIEIMDKELEDLLYNDFRSLLREMPLSTAESCLGRGIETEDGWFDLIYAALNNLDLMEKNYGIKIVVKQIKNKLGLLRIYAEVFKDGERYSSPEVFSYLNSIECESENICEKCGCEGEPRVIRRYMISLCDDDYVKMMEESDG